MPTITVPVKRALILAAALLLGLATTAALDGNTHRQGPQVPVDVALDPGHSSWDVGATASGLREHELTLDAARRVQAHLTDLGYTARLTRESAARVAPSVPADPTGAIQTEQFARHAAAGAARAFVSIHFNGHPSASLRGTETYFNSDNFGEQSSRLATSIQMETIAAIRSVDPMVPDRGVKEDLAAGKPYGHFFSLRGPFPSALLEVLFLSNPGDAALARDEAIRDSIAHGIARGIARFLDEDIRHLARPEEESQ